MAISDAFKALISDGAWARSPSAEREEPQDVDLVREIGWPLSYEQVGTGREPERTVFNQLHYEITSALLDIAAYGVLPWDPGVDYVPTADAHCFVTTNSRLWVTDQRNGPSFGNATNPDRTGQTIWQLY